jgi:hypothetical protein
MHASEAIAAQHPLAPEMLAQWLQAAFHQGWLQDAAVLTPATPGH